MTSWSLFLVAFCIVTEIARELFFKLGVTANEEAQRDGGFLANVIASPLLMVGIGFWAAEIIAWIVLLEDVPLHIAFPLMSLVYIGLPLASRAFLNEPICTIQWVGAGLIAVGVALIGTSGQ